MSLEEFLKEVKDIREYKRGMAVKLFLAGQSRQEIGQMLCVSKAYVSKWRSRYQKQGVAGLYLTYQGSQSYLTATAKGQVLNWIDTQAPAIGVAKLETYLDSTYGIKYESKRSYYDLLHQAGISYKKGQAVNPKKDEQKMLAKREEIKKK